MSEYSQKSIREAIDALRILADTGDEQAQEAIDALKLLLNDADEDENIMRTPSDNISMRERIGNMRLAYNTITGEVFAGGIKRKNKIYKDSKGYYVIEGYGTFMKKKYPIKKYFNPNENDVITAFIEGKYASGGMMKKGGITGGYEDLTDMYMSQKIEMLLSKIRPYENYYIDQVSNKLYIYFTTEITTDESQYVMDLLTSSPEFFKADTAAIDYDSERDRAVVSVELNRKVEYGKGGTTFQDKVNAISRRLDGTEVPRRLRSDYGRRYNKEEAKKAAQRIAGAMRKKGY